MSSLQVEFLMQCPCSDGGFKPLLLLALFAGTWLLFNSIKKLIKSKGVSLMKEAIKILIIIALVAFVGIAIAVKQHCKSSDLKPDAAASLNTNNATKNTPVNLENTSNSENSSNLPRLLDLGAGKCIPCKMMAPILEELKAEYTGRLEVEFIDVWKNPDEANKYGIKIIPVQIFFDASGKELFRHEGFFSKEDILSKWKEFGVNLAKGTNNETN